MQSPGLSRVSREFRDNVLGNSQQAGMLTVSLFSTVPTLPAAELRKTMTEHCCVVRDVDTDGEQVVTLRLGRQTRYVNFLDGASAAAEHVHLLPETQGAIVLANLTMPSQQQQVEAFLGQLGKLPVAVVHPIPVVTAEADAAECRILAHHANVCIVNALYPSEEGMARVMRCLTLQMAGCYANISREEARTRELIPQQAKTALPTVLLKQGWLRHHQAKGPRFSVKRKVKRVYLALDQHGLSIFTDERMTTRIRRINMATVHGFKRTSTTPTTSTSGGGCSNSGGIGAGVSGGASSSSPGISSSSGGNGGLGFLSRSGSGSITSQSLSGTSTSPTGDDSSGDAAFSILAEGQTTHLVAESGEEGQHWLTMLHAVHYQVKPNVPLPFANKSSSIFELSLRGVAEQAVAAAGRFQRTKYRQLLKHAELIKSVSPWQDTPVAAIHAVLAGDITLTVPRQSTRVRIFLAATLEDSLMERNFLLHETSLYLREFGRRLGLAVELVDPLQGFQPAEADDHLLTDTCLRELEGCLENAKTTAVVALMGGKYGLHRLPRLLPVSEFSLIRSTLLEKRPSEAKALLSLLAKWYQVDDNYVPPAMVLQPISTHFPIKSADAQEALFAWDQWLFEEQRLRHCLMAGQPPASLNTGAPSGLLELELLRAAGMENQDRNKQVLIFCRNFRPEAVKPEHRAFSKFFDTVPEDQAGSASLGRLITDSLDRSRVVCMTNVEWDGNEGLSASSRYLEDLADNFCDRVVEDILGSYENVHSEPLLQEVLFHRQQLLNVYQFKSSGYLPRPEVQAPLQRYLDISAMPATATTPMLLLGKPGSGKSWLLTNALQQVTQSQPRATVLYRFCGTSLDSSVPRLLLASLCDQLQRLYPTDLPICVPAPSCMDFSALCTHFRSTLATAAAAAGPAGLFLFLDNVHSLQLSSGDVLQALAWLPLEGLPRHCRMLVSLSPSLLKQLAAKVRISRTSVLSLDNFDIDLSFATIQRLLAARTVPRKVTSDQARTVAAAFRKTSTPLFLALALEMAASWPADALDNIMADFLKAAERGVLGLFTLLCTQLEHEYGAVFVRSVFQNLLTAGHGLSDEEMVTLLASSDAVCEELHHGHRPLLEAEQGCRLHWLRLKHRLSWCLREYRVCDSVVSVSCRHKLFRNSLESLYSELDGGPKAAALRLLHFFHGQLTAMRRCPAEKHALMEILHLAPRTGLGTEMHACFTDLTFLATGFELGVAPECIQTMTQAMRKHGLAWLAQYIDFLQANVTNQGASLQQQALLSRSWPDIQQNARELLLAGARETRHLLLEWTYGICVPELARVSFESRSHTESISQLSLNQTGSKVLLVSGTVLTLHDVPTGSCLTHCQTDLNMVITSGLLDTHGDYALSASQDGTLHLWDAVRGKQIGMHEHGGGAVLSCQFSRDRSCVLFRTLAGNAFIWKIDENLTRELEGHAGAVTDCSFDPGSLLCATASKDGMVRLWDGYTSRLKHSFQGHTDSVNSIQWKADGSLLLSCSEDGTLRVWHAQHYTCVACCALVSAVLPRAKPFFCTFDPLGDYVLVACSDGQRCELFLCLLRGEQATVMHSRELNNALKPHDLYCGFTPDGNYILHLSTDGCTILAAQDLEPFGAVAGAWTRWAISADSQRLVLGGQHGCIVALDFVYLIEEQVQLTRHTGQVRSCALSLDGQLAASVGNDNRVVIWSEALQQAKFYPNIAHTGRINKCLFNANGTQLLTCSSDTTVCLWNVADATLVRELRGHAGSVQTADMTPDDKLVASGGTDCTVIVWTLATGTACRSLEHQAPVQACKWSPSASRLLTASGSTLRLWDVDRTHVLLQVPETADITSCAFTRLGDYMLVGLANGTVDKISCRDSASRFTVASHSSEADVGVSACPRSRLEVFVTASADGSVRMWDGDSDHNLLSVFVDRRGLTCLSMAHSNTHGLRIMAGNRTGQIYLLQQASVPTVSRQGSARRGNGIRRVGSSIRGGSRKAENKAEKLVSPQPSFSGHVLGSYAHGTLGGSSTA